MSKILGRQTVSHHRIISHYRIIDLLGAGGMSQVYRAKDIKLKRTVTLKQLASPLGVDEHYRRRFVQEAKRAACLVDPHIAGLYDILEEEGELFLVMEYVEGQTLRQRLVQPLNMEEFLPVAVQCAEALTAAHEHGIVHRDVRPENIMLTPAGQVKILDLGVARALPSIPAATVTADIEEPLGALTGTPAYLPPEELLQKESDGRADLFSLGVVFYEALTGQHPFLRKNFIATADCILHLSPLPPRQLNPAISEEFERIVQKCLEKDPGNRYQSAKELLVDLRSQAAPSTAPRLPATWAAGLSGRTRARSSVGAPRAEALATLQKVLGPALRKVRGGNRLLAALSKSERDNARALLTVFLDGREQQPIRDLAAEMLEELGDRSVVSDLKNAAVDAAKYPDHVRATAIEMLAELDRENSIDFLLQLLEKEHSSEVKRRALFALRTEKFPEGKRERAIHIALNCLDDPSEGIQLQAIDLLRLLRVPSQKFLDLLVSPSTTVRMHAVEAIAACGTGDHDSPAALVELLHKDKAFQVRAYVTRALRDMGYKPAIPELKRLLHQEDPFVAAEAATALAALGAKDALRDFAILLREKVDDQYVLQEVLNAAEVLAKKVSQKEQSLWLELVQVGKRVVASYRKAGEIPAGLRNGVTREVNKLLSFYDV